MSMRLQVIVAENLYDYHDQFYTAHPNLAAQPYAVQLAALRADCFTWQVFWADALAKLGYETDLVIANAEPLQKQWAREHGIPYTDDQWLPEITAAQVKAFRPDVLYVTTYHTFSAPYLHQLRAASPSIRLVLGWCGAPYANPDVFHQFDIVLSNIRELVEHFRAQGHNSHHVNHAFEPYVLDHLVPSVSAPLDFTFVGGVVRRNRFHQAREQLLIQLVQQTDLQIFTHLSPAPARIRLEVGLRRLLYDAVQQAQHWGVPARRIPVLSKVTRWEKRPKLPSRYGHPELVRRVHPAAFGLTMYQKLRDSRLTLNIHIDLSADSASNLRLYEATGVGTCLLTDWKPNIAELFEPDQEIVTYNSPDEAIEKVRYLLEHDDERRAIAAAGQQRTLRDHTVAQRAALLDRIIVNALQNR